jgi:hypothetical protein
MVGRDEGRSKQGHATHSSSSGAEISLPATARRTTKWFLRRIMMWLFSAAGKARAVSEGMVGYCEVWKLGLGG